jgi:hypothetical protein
MNDYPIVEENAAVDPSDRQQKLGEVYAFLIDLARQKRAAAQSASADLAEPRAAPRWACSPPSRGKTSLSNRARLDETWRIFSRLQMYTSSNKKMLHTGASRMIRT